jgi:hypothetical protein
VGVVIGVADLILPDKNIGEVGRQLAQHFQKIADQQLKIADTFSLFFCFFVVDGGKIFSIYLLIPGLVWYVVLHIDLRRHAVNDHQQPASWTEPDCMSCHSLDSERFSTTSAVNGYTFRRGRHSGSFFLKIGAAGNQKNRP